MEETIKLNLACGNDYREGFVNIDDQSIYKCKVDQEADIKTLEWKENSVSEIILSHFAMYLRPQEMATLLNRWKSWLIESGKLEIECIDIKKVAKIVANEKNLTLVHSHGLINLFGNEATKPHQWGWSPKSLTIALYQAGFSDVKVLKGTKISTRDFKLVATK